MVVFYCENYQKLYKRLFSNLLTQGKKSSDKNMEKQIRPRIETLMHFSHKGEILTARHPFYGPANFLTLLNQIRNSPNIREPTASEVASFANEYFNGKEPQAKYVTSKMKSNYFRGFTGILYLPNERLAHFIDNPEFDANSVVDRDNLLRRLSESRAQVPFEHLKEGAVNWRGIANHPYFIAWADGREGAEKLSELASKHPRQEAYSWIPNFEDLREPIARVAALDSNGFGLRLGVVADDSGDNGGRCSFGVLN